MPKKTLYHPELAEDLDILLGELCSEWDFCSDLTGAEMVKDGKMLTSKRFTDMVLAAEGMEQNAKSNWHRRIKRRFVQRYGHEVSSKTWTL